MCPKIVTLLYLLLLQLRSNLAAIDCSVFDGINNTKLSNLDTQNTHSIRELLKEMNGSNLKPCNSAVAYYAVAKPKSCFSYLCYEVRDDLLPGLLIHSRCVSGDPRCLTKTIKFQTCARTSATTLETLYVDVQFGCMYSDREFC
ncbi:hypothetical protein BOX15_Mlig005035g2 [Macrostomum lignano]|uniref:SUEL-type lectin domain-containing protein n=1 Tax=Macrostomum lignano TaxID=282301 RepID=A0A267E0Z6_9PLAT|nr:hypothetical protein BOX15_Mlig005035g1 [Macrostomum lignano]PAA84042.1 hypothetical protein BOX15_Mlig005035g2 [Macrostomum lignano]